MAGKFSRDGQFGPNRTYRHAEPGTKPPVSAGDPDYERSQPITAEDRQQMLRTYFHGRGLRGAELEAALGRKA